MTSHGISDRVLADHTLLLAIPAFFPAVIVVGVVLFVALRDRRQPDGDEAGSTDEANTNEDV
jgi:hypothetical protein